MQNRSDKLVQIANKYIEASSLNIIYAYVGGSVGRGDADEYSDLDLAIYTNTHFPTKKLDVVYSGEIIQLEILHIDQVPNQHLILQSPWDYRFIAEQRIIKDNDGVYQQIKRFATSYFNSESGKKRMFEQVSNIVRERNKFAFECLDTNKYYSANLASMGAWAEAGFYYLFVTSNSLSTGELIPHLQKLKKHMHQFNNVSPFPNIVDLSDIPLILSSFRKLLREEGHTFLELADIHDTLCERKIQRLLNKNERLNLLWQMYGEAVGLYFETSNGLTFECYFQHLPISIQNDLAKIGLVPLDKGKVIELSRLSEELLSLSC